MKHLLRTALIALFVLLPLSSVAESVGNMIGIPSTYRTLTEDMLHDVARRFGLGYIELVAANPGVDPWIPEPGQQVVLPTVHILPDAPREGIVVNLSELRLYWFPPGGQQPRSYPVGIGRLGRTTPIGETRVVRKRVDPTWIPTARMRREDPGLPSAVPPGPDNPLGKHALDLAWTSYVIHGTNLPDGVGRRVSRGCIRLYPEHIELLFRDVPVGTKVTVVDQPVKLGWSAGELYLEVHPTSEEVDEIEETGGVAEPPRQDLSAWIKQKAGADAARLDWEVIKRVQAERHGVPVRITH